MPASSSPEIRTPRLGQSLSRADPVVKWADFRSGELQTYERREGQVRIYEDGPKAAVGELEPVRRLLLTEIFTPSAVPSAVSSLRARSEWILPKHLKEGNYRLQVAFHELRKFGPVTLVRESGTEIAFGIGK